jgi:hypothetical protein
MNAGHPVNGSRIDGDPPVRRDGELIGGNLVFFRRHPQVSSIAQDEVNPPGAAGHRGFTEQAGRSCTS